MSYLDLSNKLSFSYAPGKIILIGEHAVVYGSKAIAMPIEQGLRIAIYPLKNPIKNEGPLLKAATLLKTDIYFNQKDEKFGVFYEILDYLLSIFGEKIRELAIVVDSNILPARGLGSSASLSVALIKSLYQYFDWQLSEETLSNHAAKLETIFHMRPSGIDHTVIIKNQPIGFKKVDNSLVSWDIKQSCDLNFVVASINSHIGTKNAVTKIFNQVSRDFATYNRIFSEIDILAQEMELAIINGYKFRIGELMNITQGYLNALGVSCESLEQLCFIARNAGAIGAKLTGAGGGGSIIALSDGNAEEIKNAFLNNGCEAFISSNKVNHL